MSKDRRRGFVLFFKGKDADFLDVEFKDYQRPCGNSCHQDLIKRMGYMTQTRYWRLPSVSIILLKAWQWDYICRTMYMVKIQFLSVRKPPVHCSICLTVERKMKRFNIPMFSFWNAGQLFTTWTKKAGGRDKSSIIYTISRINMEMCLKYLPDSRRHSWNKLIKYPFSGSNCWCIFH